MLRPLRGLLGKSPGHRPRQPQTRLELERLQDRIVPCHSPVTLHGPTLTIHGTVGDDNVSVSPDTQDATKLDVAFNFHTYSFPLSGVKLIVFSGRGGDDLFVNNTSIPTHAAAGTGNSTLIGGSGNDLLVAGTGDDLLIGGAGNDTLLGSRGNDTLVGGDGNDSLVAGAGHDLLQGGAGNDILISGLGKDTLDGGTGNDFAVNNNGSAVLGVEQERIGLALTARGGGAAQGSAELLVDLKQGNTLIGVEVDVQHALSRQFLGVFVDGTKIGRLFTDGFDRGHAKLVRFFPPVSVHNGSVLSIQDSTGSVVVSGRMIIAGDDATT